MVLSEEEVVKAIDEVRHQLTPSHTGMRLFATMLKMKLGLDDDN